MFSRQTMQIRTPPQGDTVNGFNHQQNLQRGVCVSLCAYAGISNTNMPPASCKQITKKNKQKHWKILKQRQCPLWPSTPPKSPNHSVLVLGKDFLTYRSWLWQWEQRWMPDRDSDQNSSVGSHKFSFNIYPITTWLENREKRNKVGN